MKITPKIAMVVGIVLLLAGGLCANRYSMICPVHHVLAYATGQLRASGTECEYRHSLEKGKMHTFWAKCNQLGLKELPDPKEFNPLCYVFTVAVGNMPDRMAVWPYRQGTGSPLLSHD